MYRLKWLLEVDLLKGTFRTRGLHAFKKIEDMTHFRSPKHKIPARLGRKIETDVQFRIAGFQLIIEMQCLLVGNHVISFSMSQIDRCADVSALDNIFRELPALRKLLKITQKAAVNVVTL